MMNVVLFVLIGISIYIFLEKMVTSNYINKFNDYILKKNEKYYEDLLKYYDKNKKIKLKEKRIGVTSKNRLMNFYAHQFQVKN